MNAPHPDVVTIVIALNHLEGGGQPYASGTPECTALDNAVHRCTQTPALAGYAALARRALTAARRGAQQGPA